MGNGQRYRDGYGSKAGLGVSHGVKTVKDPRGIFRRVIVGTTQMSLLGILAVVKWSVRTGLGVVFGATDKANVNNVPKTNTPSAFSKVKSSGYKDYHALVKEEHEKCLFIRKQEKKSWFNLSTKVFAAALAVFCVVGMIGVLSSDLRCGVGDMKDCVDGHCKGNATDGQGAILCDGTMYKRGTTYIDFASVFFSTWYSVLSHTAYYTYATAKQLPYVLSTAGTTLNYTKEFCYFAVRGKLEATITCVGMLGTAFGVYTIIKAARNKLKSFRDMFKETEKDRKERDSEMSRLEGDRNYEKDFLELAVLLYNPGNIFEFRSDSVCEMIARKLNAEMYSLGVIRCDFTRKDVIELVDIFCKSREDNRLLFTHKQFDLANRVLTIYDTMRYDPLFEAHIGKEAEAVRLRYEMDKNFLFLSVFQDREIPANVKANININMDDAMIANQGFNFAGSRDGGTLYRGFAPAVSRGPKKSGYEYGTSHLGCFDRAEGISPAGPNLWSAQQQHHQYYVPSYPSSYPPTYPAYMGVYPPQPQQWQQPGGTGTVPPAHQQQQHNNAAVPQQPAASQPAVSQPAASQPAVSQPAASQPAAASQPPSPQHHTAAGAVSERQGSEQLISNDGGSASRGRGLLNTIGQALRIVQVSR